MGEPKEKKAPRRERKAYNNARNEQKRKAECKEAGVPYTKHIKLATATACLVEKGRKAARPQERAEHKEDVAAAVKEATPDWDQT